MSLFGTEGNRERVVVNFFEEFEAGGAGLSPK